jgi:hypothetical protein
MSEYLVRKCAPNCKCMRHRKSGGDTALTSRAVRARRYRDEFLRSTLAPYRCEWCTGEINVSLHWRDGDALVLCRIDGDLGNTSLENLAPMHRGCRLARAHTGALLQLCECGMRTNVSGMIAHVKRAGHEVIVEVAASNEGCGVI